MERREHQNPRPFQTHEGSATLKGKTSHSALTYWSGTIQPRALVDRRNAKGFPTRPFLSRWAISPNDSDTGVASCHQAIAPGVLALEGQLLNSRQQIRT